METPTINTIWHLSDLQQLKFFVPKMMKLIVLAFILVGVTQSAVHRIRNKISSGYDEEWKEFKANFNKNYDSEVEEVERRKTWESNLLKIEHHNVQFDLGKSSYSMAMNQFGDLTLAEFQHLMKISEPVQMDHSRKSSAVEMEGDIPASIDWRQKGCVSPVQDQGQCGTVAAFSATGALEGQSCRSTGKLLILSVQNLEDCAFQGGCSGGGIPDDAFAWVQKNGIETAADYPNGGEGNCKYDPSKKAVGDNGFVDIEKGNETQLAIAITQGPVSVLIDASQASFQFYSSGIYNEPACSSTELDHALLAVGYETNPEAYYIAKNSWGTSWGMSGYILMSRNKSNQCGIVTLASYPLI